MSLSAQVVKIESGSSYKDGIPRVTLHFDNAEGWNCCVTFKANLLHNPLMDERFEFESIPRPVRNI